MFSTCNRNTYHSYTQSHLTLNDLPLSLHIFSLRLNRLIYSEMTGLVSSLFPSHEYGLVPEQLKVALLVSLIRQLSKQRISLVIACNTIISSSQSLRERQALLSLFYFVSSSTHSWQAAGSSIGAQTEVACLIYAHLTTWSVNVMSEWINVERQCRNQKLLWMGAPLSNDDRMEQVLSQRNKVFRDYS